MNRKEGTKETLSELDEKTVNGNHIQPHYLLGFLLPM